MSDPIDWNVPALTDVAVSIYVADNTGPATLHIAIEHSGAPLRLRPVYSGIHAIADVDGIDAEDVCREAAARSVEAVPLSHYYFGVPPESSAILLGFGSVRPAAIRAAVIQLAEAIEAVQRGKAAAGTPRVS
ncbi:MAG TPA: hypothetical protein VFS24_19525 [Steroidobacteraceae bacterium]|nr:hypothetical protein [Steroidobacteraceae bacterium]